jgi:hypothetical protein
MEYSFLAIKNMNSLETRQVVGIMEPCEEPICEEEGDDMNAEASVLESVTSIQEIKDRTVMKFQGKWFRVIAFASNEAFMGIVITLREQFSNGRVLGVLVESLNDYTDQRLQIQQVLGLDAAEELFQSVLSGDVESAVS